VSLGWLVVMAIFVLVWSGAHMVASGQPAALQSEYKVKIGPKVKPIYLTRDQLRKYDGSDLSKPIYLSVRGKIFDVTAGRRHYSPQSAYGWYSGKETEMIFGKMCYKEECLDDTVESMTPEQLKEVDYWENFYEVHDEYELIGYLKDYKPEERKDATE